MSDQPATPDHPRNAFDRADGYSGQDYTAGREIAEGARDADPPRAPDSAALPPDNGHRAAVDRVTGEVRGAGVGAGGGQPGEDLDQDAATGSGYPLTGGEGSDKIPGSLGPAQDE